MHKGKNIVNNTTELSIDQKRELLTQLLQKKDDNNAVIYPLSYGQRALWLLTQLSPQSSAYTIHMALRIRSAIDPASWKKALLELMRRHPILCTTFTTYNGHPVSITSKIGNTGRSGANLLMESSQMGNRRHTDQSFSDEYMLEMHTIAEWTEEELQGFVQEARQRPFDLEREYPFRCLLLTCSSQEHILLFIIHHIIADGWTVSTLLYDLLYLATGKAAHLPPPQSQYRHFVHWQRELLASARGKQLRDYWQQQLTGTLLPLNLPFERPQSGNRRDPGAIVAISMGALTSRLRDFARAENVTLYTLLLAGFMLLLYRYSQQEDMLIGSPMAGRSRPEFEQVAGYFANLVVLRSRLSETLTLRQFLESLQQTVLGAVEHQDYPFALLVEQLQPERDLSFQPLTNIAFAMESLALDKGNFFPLMCEEKGFQHYLGGLRLEAFSQQSPQEGTFDLTLMVFEHEKHLRAFFQYNAELFEEASICGMAQHFPTLLNNLLISSEQRIADISLLSQEERYQLLVAHNQTERVYESNICAHQHFEHLVALAPDALALCYEQEQICYRELDRRANYLARVLRDQGVGPDTLVGVCLPRIPDLFICLLAILKAGGAYVPLDPSLPAERLAGLIEEAHLSVILTRSHERTCLPSSGTDLRLLVLDEAASRFSGCADLPPQNACLPTHLAYVIYTSGTTGRPKGVAVTHQGLLNLVRELQRQLQIQGGTRVIQCASLAFDASLLEVALALFTGGSLYVPSSPLLLGAELARVLSEEAIELAFFTPSLLSTLPEVSLLALKTLLMGGEACPLELMRLWSRGRRCYNLYGPTEITILSSCALCSPEQTSIPLGYPIANARHYVLDAHLHPVPIGVPGELYIGGTGLARGYLDHPELTALRFLPHPFAQQPGERLYRTGDRVRWRVDGTIEFLGRIDQQVKLRGYRIELAEIESIICQQTGVRACLVTLDTAVASDPHLVAYLIMETPAPSIHDLLLFLKQHLPAYMIPTYFVPLAAFPLTIQGKVDRNALPSPTALHLAPAKSHVLPETTTERMLIEIWQNLLEVTEVHRDDDFFELGGHSLLLTHLATEIQERFDLLLPLSVLIEQSTVAALAYAIDQRLNPVSREVR